MDEHTTTGDYQSDSNDSIRVTSPMQPFNMSAVTTGIIITIIGLGIIFGIPFILS
ncbi:hypothetical protein [Haloquadratum walsbyi]|jgi:hypothetical protein|uniref:Uncharacterized protein n=1 Tax=Haloquadratum walsbyi J07HQW2 TaxID=1238425 RepID=U1NII7_9EURY|nr:hypothetical protein [Haloquadratum walsbyi]ERG96728.1 MAG: hypothetical protein J07HQW2_03211 [Haloquadratum walsbyi J07HQW2]